MLIRAASGLHSQPDECPNILLMNSVRSILVIFSHLFLPLPSGSICQVSPTKTLYAFMSSSLHAHSSRDKLRITLKWILCMGVERIQLFRKRSSGELLKTQEKH